MRSLIGKALGFVDDVGVETVLTLAFVAQFAAYALPVHAADDIRIHLLSDEGDIAETGTVVQMPANPSGGRTARAVVARPSKGTLRPSASAAPKAARAAGTLPARVRRPDPVDDERDGEELEQLRAAESSVRITIIGPDGQPRTKVVRLSGSRDGMAAPARRPHD